MIFLVVTLLLLDHLMCLQADVSSPLLLNSKTTARFLLIDQYECLLEILNRAVFRMLRLNTQHTRKAPEGALITLVGVTNFYISQQTLSSHQHRLTQGIG